MKILIIASKKTYENTELLRAADDLKVHADLIPIKNFIIENKDNNFNAKANLKNIFNYDIFLFRTIKPYLAELTGLGLFLKSKGKTIIDENLVAPFFRGNKSIFSSLCAINKLPHPKTVQIFDKKKISQIKDTLNPPYIIKHVDKDRGTGVYLAKNYSELNKFINENGINHYIVQEQLTKKIEDYRVFIVGKRCIGTMKKTAKEGEYRSNAMQGAKCSIVKKKEIEKLALKAAKITLTDIAGVDIMYDDKNKPYLLEVNSAPQFKTFMMLSKIDVARKIIEYAIEKFLKSQNKSISYSLP